MKMRLMPETPKTKLYCYFKAICSECGSFHLYYKTFGWQKTKNFKFLCFPKGSQLNLF
jgi:hypothetical protein